METKIKYDFTGNELAKNKESEANKIAKGNIYQYNKDINDVSLNVEDLDRIDDFDHLKISLDSYAQKGFYGIEKDENIHLNGVILSHQENAAKEFLQNLRGFGLLADVVGAGKTYEAGVVLSELSARNLLKSLLVVVPEHLIDQWQKALEIKFAMGVKSVYVSKHGEICDLSADGLRPNKPILISLENFAKWDESYKRYLFDAIVVDEAHNLCLEKSKDEDVDYKNALYILSLLMQTKKKHNNGYCILLSATPHSGNLEQMFKLWYFIRCKGGNPNDFIKDEKYLTNEFKKEREYYFNTICRQSKTVMEFIKHVEINESEGRYKNLFERFLLDEKKLSYDNYLKKCPSFDQKIVYVEEFIDSYLKRNNPEIKEAIFKSVSNAYHNGILRTIMVRQSKKSLQKTKRNIYVKNLYFVSCNKPFTGKQNIKDLNNETITIDYDKLYDYHKVIDFSDDYKPIYRDNSKLPYSIKEYSNLYRPSGYTSFEATVELYIDHIIKNICDDTNKKIYKKDGTLAFLKQAMLNTPDDIENYLIPYQEGQVDEYYLKTNFLYRVFENHPNEKIVVFFDYETLKYDRDFMIKFKDLLLNSKYKDRLIFSTEDEPKIVEKKYDNKDNPILICVDEKFTEGINLQSGNVIVNYSITPNPLAMNQRIGRIDRLGQAKEIYIYSFAMLNTLEGFSLPYLSSIGIMNSKSNDATIISGSSNEKMAAIQCPICNKVKMISKEKYELYDKQDDIAEKIKNGIYCGCEGSYQYSYGGRKYTRMTEINLSNCKCNNCGKVFNRLTKNDALISNKHFSDGRLCFAETQDKMLLESDESKTFYCSKICAMKHCKFFMNNYKDCAVLKAYNNNPNIPIAQMMFYDDDLCGSCKNKCPEKCRPYNPDKIVTGRELISKCIDCVDGNNCGSISTKEKHIRPHILTFDEKWNAPCPYCHKGRLEPVEDSTFENFIRNSWKFNGDGGESFAGLMLEELERVNDIKAILENDEVA